MVSQFTDHLGRSVQLPAPPQRIISLCPSQTELLFTLGLADRIVGRTHFCIHPSPAIEKVQAVGGTKNLKEDRILDLQPDLIICEKEENTPEMVAWLQARYPVYITDVRDLPSALRMIHDLADLTGTSAQGQQLIHHIQSQLQTIQPLQQSPSLLYFIWRKPWMVVGADTYIHAILQNWGANNLGATLQGRYPTIEPQDLASLKPEWILLSSEPFPFAQKHIAELKAIFPESKIQLVDGEMFSWYGSRMLEMPAYLNHLKKDLEAQ